MLTSEQMQIVRDVYDDVDDEFGDSSAEFVMAVTCERAAQRIGIVVDAGDVTDSLLAERTPEPRP